MTPRRRLPRSHSTTPQGRSSDLPESAPEAEVDYKAIDIRLWYRIQVWFQICLSAWYQLVWQIQLLEEGMTLAISRFWGGVRHDQSAVDGEAEGEGENVPLLEKVGGKKVKRRRRKEDHTVVQEQQQYFPGMVNLSGVLCYMNAVLQSLASVTSLTTHLDRIEALAMEVDFPTPVTDALSDVLKDLNTPQTRQPPPLRPHALLRALHPLPQIRRLVSTREQQDAHELFVVLAEAISDEALKVATEVMRIRGMAEALSLQAYCSRKGGGGMDPIGRAKKAKARGIAQPWEGLMARRRVCRRCGWCEAVRMDTLGGMELPVPLHGDTSLDNCIAEYLAPENLSGVTCEMCSLRQTLEFYKDETTRLSLPHGQHQSPIAHSQTVSGSFSILENLPILPEPNGDAVGPISDKRKKKAREARKVEVRLQQMVDSNTISHFGESALPPLPGSGTASATGLPIKWQTVNSDSTREALITRPPQSLRLHFIRSGYTPYGTLVKKAGRVAFPTILDLTRFVSRGVWEDRTMIRHMLNAAPPQNEVPQTKVYYRLESVILHYGYTHSSGHFVCIRRKPTLQPDGTYLPVTIRKSCPDGCGCEDCIYFGQVREEHTPIPGKGWLQVSDADVEEVGEEALIEARGAVFMCLYERVGEYDDVRSRGVSAVGKDPG